MKAIREYFLPRKSRIEDYRFAAFYSNIKVLPKRTSIIICDHYMIIYIFNIAIRPNYQHAPIIVFNISKAKKVSPEHDSISIVINFNLTNPARNGARSLIIRLNLGYESDCLSHRCAVIALPEREQITLKHHQGPAV